MNKIWLLVNQSKTQKILIAALFLIIAALFAINFDVKKMEVFLYENEELGLIISLFSFLLLGVTFIPSEPVTVVLTAWQGPLVAIILATVGNTMAALAEYFIGGRIRDASDFENKRAKLPFHLGKLPINSTAFLFLVRLLPGFGPKFVGFAGGIYRVNLFSYTWTAILANLIGATILALSGYGIINLIW